MEINQALRQSRVNPMVSAVDVKREKMLEQYPCCHRAIKTHQSRVKHPCTNKE